MPLIPTLEQNLDFFFRIQSHIYSQSAETKDKNLEEKLKDRTGLKKFWTPAQFTTTDDHRFLRKQREAKGCRDYLQMFPHAGTLGLRTIQKKTPKLFLGLALNAT